MSLDDVIQSGQAWLAATAAFEAAQTAWRADYGMDLWNAMTVAQKVQTDAHRAHLAAMRDLPHGDEHDDARIVALRNDNERLRDHVKKLRFEVAKAVENNATRNRELDALHYVWCDGGCTGGAHRYCGSREDITEEVVATAERNTLRLRRWFTNYQHKQQRKIQPPTPTWFRRALRAVGLSDPRKETILAQRK